MNRPIAAPPLLLACLLIGACQKAEPPAAAPVAAEPAATPSSEPPTLMHPDLTVEGSAFVLKIPDGRVLQGVGMQGAIVHLSIEGSGIRSIKLESIAPDPEHADVLRHDFRIQDAKGEWVPACKPNADGETWGFPVALPEGHPGREGPITLTCVSGAVGKCARFGYRPWATGPKGESLLPYHAACVQMVRGDYCGNGTPHTKDGTMIDMYDDLGIQKVGSLDDPEFAFEAGWGEHGAACVARTRWPDLLSRDQLGKECPRFAEAPEACDEKHAREKGALIFNRSRPVARTGK